MRYLGAIVSVTLASAVQLAACSPRVTSLDAEKTFTALSADERRQFCEDQSHYMSSRISTEDHRKIACSVSAGAVLLGATDREKALNACRQSYQACLSVPTEEQPSSCEGFAADAATCAATVGDASKCAEGRADNLARLAAKADDTCKDTSQRTTDKAEPAQAETCVRVESLCPKLFTEPGKTQKPEPGTNQRQRR